MPTVAQVLRSAYSEVGYTENPPGSNDTKFAAEAHHPNGFAWCDTFVVAIARRTGLVLPSWGAYTPTSADAYRAAGAWHTTDPQPGDQVFYRWPGSTRIDHTGFVVSVDGRSLHTIEGNTSADNNGSQSNGGGVFARTRRWDSTVAGFGRPVYTADPPTPLPDESDDTMRIYIPTDDAGNDHDPAGKPFGPQELVIGANRTTLGDTAETDECVAAGAEVHRAKPLAIALVHHLTDLRPR